MDWQTIIVALIILAALAYTARRGLARFNSFRANNSSCTTGCGSCGGSEKPVTNPAKVLVSIDRLSTLKRPNTR
ncbi:MAG: FeoB-associated Cys-rich membrane protein [Pyrinomonadaceae bacterium]